jgi:PD-(D/E)XK nuclease superfamily
MGTWRLNRLGSSIRDLCLSRPLSEKWIIAPSRRVGYQWLDAVARSGCAVLNARVNTLESLAMELAGKEMQASGARRIGSIEAEIMMSAVIADLDDNYLAGLSPSRKLTSAVLRTLEDLRLAGLASADLSADLFESIRKGKAIIRLLSLYESALASGQLVDASDVFRLAERVLHESAALPPDLVICMPEDMEDDLRPAQRSLWKAFPESSRLLLATDAACGQDSGDGGDSSRLAWVCRPSDAPPSKEDGDAEIFRAVGEANEVREVIRRCLRNGVPFDEVEILHTDSATYPSLIYEVCATLKPEGGNSLPVTFHEGIPLRYSRPGRALAGWLSFTKDSYPQAVLVRLIQEGLMQVADTSPGFSLIRLAAELRSLPIYSGSERHIKVIGACISHQEASLSGEPREASETGLGDTKETLDRLALLRELKALVEDLSSWAPQNGRDWKEGLAGVESFLRSRARCVNELDEYARVRLLDEVQALGQSIGDGADPPFRLEDWLSQLIRSGRVEGEGPRPGCIYVAPLHSGGHSGRGHTFILGLDEARFPGSALQDPLLLDGERGRISRQLPTASERLGKSLEEFSRLMAGIRGRITLSYSCRDIEDDRDIFPSQVILSAYRILSGNKEGLLRDFLQWMPQPISFAPLQASEAMNMDDWWCAHMGSGSLEGDRRLLTEAFPHLGRGYQAAAARESDSFTVYDGFVAQAGVDLDPCREEGPVLSASRLEKLARCPLEYFMQYVLEIESPEQNVLDPSRWLEPDEKGDLLHRVFRKFHHSLREDGLKPDAERDSERLERILEAEISRWRDKKPFINREVFEAETKELHACASIFLFEEERLCLSQEALYFEAAAGLPSKDGGNTIDDEEAVRIPLPDGTHIQVRGYIDRIDGMTDGPHNTFTLCDYKTGSSKFYEGPDIFQAGRRIQGTLYLALAETLLAREHPEPQIETFEYFFPNVMDHGRRIRRDSEELREGMAIVARLCEMLRRGCFPLSEDPQDIRNSDYLAAFGDVQAACAGIKRKMMNSENEALLPFAILRNYQDE